MSDLSVIAEASFDLIFHPASNLFIPDVLPVWRECYRVLRPNRILLAGFINPSFFLFDHEAAASSGQLIVKNALPYCEPENLKGGSGKVRWPGEFG